MPNGYFDFLDQNSSSNPAPSEDFLMKDESVNLTLRADAECQVTCDGDFLVLLSPNQITKEKAPVGQHILQFISTIRPDIQVEKIVDFTEAGKNYLVLVNEFSELIRDVVSKEQEEVRRKQEVALREAEIARAKEEAVETRAKEQAILDAEKRKSELSEIDFVDKYTYYINDETFIDFRHLVHDVNEAIENEIKPAVDFEIASAEYVYFLILYHSNCLENSIKACEYLKKSAEHGCREAQNALGVCLQFGTLGLLGIKENIVEAINWYIQSASQGYFRAQWHLAQCYRDGIGTTINPTEAFKWYNLAVNQGDAISMCDLGWCYEFGFGTECNRSEAIKWYKLAAEKDYAPAMNSLGLMYGKIMFEGFNRSEAIKWYKLAAEKDYLPAISNLGMLYYETNDFVEAVKWLKIGAERWDVMSEYLLGMCYYEGKGCEKDLKEAKRLFYSVMNRASLSDDRAYAQYLLGMCYYEEQELKEAKEVFSSLVHLHPHYQRLIPKIDILQ